MRARVTRPGVRTAVVAVAGVAALGVTAVLAAHQPAPPTRATVPVVAETDDVPPGGAAIASGQSFPWWWLVVVIGLLALVGLLVWFVLRDSIAVGPPHDAEVDTRLRQDELGRRTAELAVVADLALAEAADDLTAGADARDVVVACWVRIEQAAAAAGLGRRPAETATDVARRWLTGRPDHAAVDELAALYHLARYSTHPLTDAHRARARVALRGALGVAT